MLEELRRSFDESFAKEVGTGELDTDGLLLFHPGDSRIAVRVTEAAEVVRRVRWTAVTSSDSSLLGLTSVRGKLVAVYDVMRLLGVDDGAGSEGWVVVAAGDRSFGIHCGSFAGLRHVPRTMATTSDGGHAAVSAKVEIDTTRYDLIHVGGLISARAKRSMGQAREE